MSSIFKIIDSLNLREAEAHKIQINLISNPEKEEKLLLVFSNKNDDAKMRFLKSFLKTLPGILDKYLPLACYIYCL